jgi:hypothetical protein
LQNQQHFSLVRSQCATLVFEHGEILISIQYQIFVVFHPSLNSCQLQLFTCNYLRECNTHTANHQNNKIGDIDDVPSANNSDKGHIQHSQGSRDNHVLPEQKLAEPPKSDQLITQICDNWRNCRFCTMNFCWC